MKRRTGILLLILGAAIYFWIFRPDTDPRSRIERSETVSEHPVTPAAAHQKPAPESAGPADTVTAPTHQADLHRLIGPSFATQRSAEKPEQLFDRRQRVQFIRQLSGPTRNQAVHLKSRSFVPALPELPSRGEFYLSFLSTPTTAQKQQLEQNGVQLLEHITRTTWRAALANPDSLSTFRFVTGVEPVWPVDKWSPTLWAAFNENPNVQQRTAILTMTESADVKRLHALFKQNGLNPEPAGDDDRVILQAADSVLLALCRSPLVAAMSLPPPPDKEHNINAAALSQIDDLQSAPYGLTGTNIHIAVRDGGEIHSHSDFGSRVTLVDNNGTSWHSTHVAGTIAGSGAGNASAKGMAVETLLYSYDFYGDNETELQDAFSRFGARLSNHSYGHVIGWSDGVWTGNTSLFGDYSAYAQDADELIHNGIYYLFKSAGNDRNDSGTPTGSEPDHDGTQYGDGDYYDCMEDVASAKNLITVGAVDDDGSMSKFSNFGPTDDGRIKPDIVANGVDLVSTYATSWYTSSSGTSMSSPAACGAAALLLEQFRALHGNAWPSVALLKGLLIHTAEDLGRPGPDYQFGWGLLDAKAAADLLRDSSPSNTLYLSETLSENETNRHDLAFSGSVSNLRVTLYWTDVEGSSIAADALVNDLDLVLISPDSNTVHNPYVMPFAQTGSSPTNPAVSGTNQWDNVEQIDVASPTNGTWTVEVSGSTVPFGPQEYVLLLNAGDLNYGYQVLRPQRGDRWYRGDTQQVHWTTGQTNGQSRIVLYHNGSNTLTLATNVATTAESFDWTVPDDLPLSTNYVIRIEASDNPAVFDESGPFEVRGRPMIDTAPSALSLTAAVQQTDSAWMTISNAGDGDLHFTISNSIPLGNYDGSDSDDADGPAYEWIDISTLGTIVPLSEDGESSALNIGFDFPFYNQTYTQFYIYDNGGISFSSGWLDWVNDALPSTAAPSQSLFPFWDDFTSGSTVRYHSTSERLVVSWLGAPFYGTSTEQTFQIVLYPDGRIVYQYKTLNGTLTSATVGLQGDNASGPSVQVAFNEDYLKESLAIEFTPPNPPWLTYSVDSGSVSPGAATSVLFTASATNLSMFAGVYTAQVNIACNDIDHPDVPVPVDFTVFVPDEDDDGLPDWWEQEFFGGKTNAVPSENPDGDGYTNEEEYVAGLNPTNSDRFVMTQLSGEGASLENLVLQWPAVSGRVYTVYWSSNLLSPFTLLQSNVTGGAFTDSLHSVNDDGFYRIEVDLTP